MLACTNTKKIKRGIELFENYRLVHFDATTLSAS